jgi:hypothetical protein
VNGQWPPTPVTVLAPVVPGREPALSAHLADLDRQSSPFRHLESTHFARLVVVGQVPPLAGVPRARRPLRLRYLLFTAVADRPAEDFIEDLRTTGQAVDEIWGHCVRYPGHRDARLFHRYMQRNSLPAQQWFQAYDASVAQVRAALALRREHLDFALATQGTCRSELQKRFLERFVEHPS